MLLVVLSLSRVTGLAWQHCAGGLCAVGVQLGYEGAGVPYKPFSVQRWWSGPLSPAVLKALQLWSGCEVQGCFGSSYSMVAVINTYSEASPAGAASGEIELEVKCDTSW